MYNVTRYEIMPSQYRDWRTYILSPTKSAPRHTHGGLVYVLHFSKNAFKERARRSSGGPGSRASLRRTCNVTGVEREERCWRRNWGDRFQRGWRCIRPVVVVRCTPCCRVEVPSCSSLSGGASDRDRWPLSHSGVTLLFGCCDLPPLDFDECGERIDGVDDVLFTGFVCHSARVGVRQVVGCMGRSEGLTCRPLLRPCRSLAGTPWISLFRCTPGQASAHYLSPESRYRTSLRSAAST